MNVRVLRPGLCAALVGLLTATAVCTADPSAAEGTQRDEDGLTSVVARSRALQFVGTVYVETNATDDAILAAVRSQTQTAFGPMRTTEIAIDLITNAVGSPAWRSGHAMGQGSPRSSTERARSTRISCSRRATPTGPPLRVVDGEVDNDFTPSKFPMTVTAR